MARPAAETTVLFEDERFRATRFDFTPGAETGWHKHVLDYVITTITPCEMALELPGGESASASLEAGDAYSRERGVEHNVINAGTAPMSFVELEIK